MADATISTKIKLDGEAEYKQRISEINAALGTLDSKIKLLNTTYAGNENSIKGLTEINEVLNQKILTQRDKVEQLQEMLQKSAKAYGISDTTTQKYQQQLNNAEAALVKWSVHWLTTRLSWRRQVVLPTTSRMVWQIWLSARTSWAKVYGATKSKSTNNQ